LAALHVAIQERFDKADRAMMEQDQALVDLGKMKDERDKAILE
jgi:hypothetical protein